MPDIGMVLDVMITEWHKSVGCFRRILHHYGPVIIYDQGGLESNDFLWKIFSRNAEEKNPGLLDIARKIT